jgi:hypothetical protein
VIIQRSWTPEDGAGEPLLQYYYLDASTTGEWLHAGLALHDSTMKTAA